jgi:hypothetical protein
LHESVDVEKIEPFVMLTNRDGYAWLIQVWTPDGRLANVLGRTDALVFTDLGLFDYQLVRTATLRSLASLVLHDA